MTCRTCRWLRVDPDEDGKVRVRRSHAYRCTVQVPPVPLPRSVKMSGWSSYNPPRPQHMEPDDGEGCFYHEDRKP